MQSNRSSTTLPSSTTGNTSQSSGESTSSRSELKQSLRGLSYEEQLQALSPGEQAEPTDRPLLEKSEKDTEEGTQTQVAQDKKPRKKLFGGDKKKEKVTPKHDASGFSKKEQKQLAKACVAALPMVTKALAKIKSGGGHYRTWMDNSAKSDATDPAISGRMDHVRAGLEKVKACLEKDEITFKKYALTDGEEDETFAYVIRSESEHNIYLGGAFWSFWTWTKGKNSRAGTIIHELSHRLHATSDHGYGTGKAKDFAKNDPAKATTNADNYEYFCETA